jgi:hypothetical protein
MRLLFPVIFRSRRALCRRIASGEVSGRKKNMIRKIGADSQTTSQSDHRQFIAGTLNPEITGPRAGPRVAKAAQAVKAYGSFRRPYMSPMLAPPVARHGLPKNPCKNRSAKRPPKLLTTAVGMLRITKSPNDII